jgi:hypothetical protein
VHATVSIAAFDGREVTLSVVGTDSRNHAVSANRKIYVESSPRWTETVSAGARLMDYDAQRVLYFDTAGSARMASRDGGGETVLRGPDPRTFGDASVPRGWLHPAGAVFSIGVANANYDWRAGTLSALGGSGATLQAAGNWAVWTGVIGYTDIFRRDLSTGATQRIATNAGNVDQAVAANGDVVFWNSDYEIMRYRGGSLTALTSSDDAVARNTAPRTDGINVVFRRAPPCCAVRGDQILMITAQGTELALTPVLTEAPNGALDYDAAGGWVAYTHPDAGFVMQVRMRSPDGVVYQATRLASPSTIQAVGPAGELVFASGTQVYVARPPYTAPPVPVGRWPSAARYQWRGGQLVTFLGRSAFTVSY